MSEYGIGHLPSLLIIGILVFFLGMMGSFFGLSEGENRTSNSSSEEVPFNQEELEMIRSVKYNQYLGVITTIGSVLFVLGISLDNLVCFQMLFFLGILLIFM